MFPSQKGIKRLQLDTENKGGCVSAMMVSETKKDRFEWKLERNILQQRFPDELSRDKAKRRAGGI